MTTKTTKTRHRRSAEDVIADLQAKIEAVRTRAATREAKAAPEGKAFVAAVRAIDKATRVATEAGSKELVSALEAARAVLAPAVVSLGLRIPEQAKRVRRRKETEAA